MLRLSPTTLVRYPSGTRTIMSPYPGGPVYQWLRINYNYFKRYQWRRVGRWQMRSWCYWKAAFYGVPEWNIDPTKNQWRWCVDPAWYGGMRDKANMDMYRLMVYPFFGYALLYLHSRFKQNDKYNVFAKRRKDDDDQQQ
ncbi:hypothetical protein FOZ63_028025 [Perkinsus olseni]|uniref:Uncharacterized protein n=1 Tax=Perkinsus olseni TaxID=32597 RepID=A0A7J6R9P9_PEROL|nr:hypothetical protein FOZ63_028025 [Perkinsus olseni]